MRSPAWALCWQVWGRHRRGLAACAAVWLAQAVLVHVLPLASSPNLLAGVVVLPSVAVLVYLIYALSFTADTHLEARDTGFPRRAFTLPVPTPALVAWPMLQAAAAAALIWLAWAKLVFAPAGGGVYLKWPAVLAAVLMAWLQAVAWAPFPARYLRLPALVLALLGVLMVAVVGDQFTESPAQLSAALAALLPPAYLVALFGVARARRGEIPEWTWPGRLAAAFGSLRPQRRAAFASPVDAQAWFEWRQYGITLPYLVSLLLFELLCFPTAEESLDEMAKLRVSAHLTALVGSRTATGVLLTGFLVQVPVMALLIGTELGAVSVKSWGPSFRRTGCASFLAVRPLTAEQFVAAKYRLAARTTLVAWAVVTAAAAVWLLATGGFQRLAAAYIWRDYSLAAKLAAAAAVMAALVGLTWLQLAGGLWAKLTGRLWVADTAAVAGIVLLAATLAGLWLYGNSEYHAAASVAAFFGAGTLIVLKLSLAGWLTRAVLRRGLVPGRSLAAAGAAWLAAAAAYTALLHRLAGVPLPTAAAVVVLLLLPLNRLLAAPLALEWNRHR